MKQIYVLCSTSADPLKFLGTGFSITKVKEEADIVLVRSEEFLFDEFPSCRFVVRLGMNTDNISTDEANKRGIMIFYAPAANANSVAQVCHLIGHSARRNIITARKETQSWKIHKDTLKAIEHKKALYRGDTFGPDTVFGIVGGAGNIGTILRNLELMVGCRVIINDLPEKMDQVHDSRLIKTTDLAELVEVSDIISVHTPGSIMTVTADMLAHAKRKAVFMDFARGESYDMAGIGNTIDEKEAQFHTDFCTVPALGLQARHPDNVFCYPHIGGLTHEAEYQCAEMSLTALKNYLETGKVACCKNADAVLAAQ